MCMKEEQFKTCNNRFVTHSFVYQFCWLISTRNLSLGTLITYVLPNIVIRWSLAEDRIGQYGSFIISNEWKFESSCLKRSLNISLLQAPRGFKGVRLSRLRDPRKCVASDEAIHRPCWRNDQTWTDYVELDFPKCSFLWVQPLSHVLKIV